MYPEELWSAEFLLGDESSAGKTGGVCVSVVRGHSNSNHGAISQHYF